MLFSLHSNTHLCVSDDCLNFLSLGGTCQTRKPFPCRMLTQPTFTSLKRLNAKFQKEAVLLSSIIIIKKSFIPVLNKASFPRSLYFFSQNRNNIKNGSILRLTTSAVSSTFEFIYVFLTSLKALPAGGTCLYPLKPCSVQLGPVILQMWGVIGYITKAS